MKFDLSQKDPIYSNLLQLLRSRASEQADFPAYTFLLDGDLQEAKITCAGLDAQARKVGGFLQEKKLKGERALLLYPPGLDYISAFFGCIYGGVIAVPAYPPDPYRLSRTLPRLKSIIQDSGAKLVLTTQEIQSMAETVFAQDPELSNLEWKATDGLEESFAGAWKEWNPGEEDLVFLQYTSGSTGFPKGVMLSHRNLIYNMHLIGHAFRLSPDHVGASWLPPYHDMGLIGGILTPLYGGGRTLLMSPLDFLKKPLSWLRMIHRHKANISGGPNFAYDLCVRKATPQFIEEIDLSSWGLAFSGAEPVRRETLKRFAETFKPAGFKEEFFYPCYGLAEGTLIVSGGVKSDPPVFKRVLRKSLETHRPQEAGEGEEAAIWLVGCGRSVQKQKVLIVDPEGETPLPEGQVGEIWASGPSIAMGYWKRPEESEKTFRARLRKKGAEPSDSGLDLPFLRTGDMGFFSEEELYVTGRIKDLIIINGQNHYPQDIELSIEKSDPAFRPGCGAVFSVDRVGDEKLVVVWEVDLHVEGAEKEALLETLTAKIRQAISVYHEIQADAVVFIRKGSIYKTSSGKIQRHACRKAYLAGELETVGEWESEKPKAGLKKILAADASFSPSPEKVALVRDWLCNEIAERMGIQPDEIDPKLPFQNFGLDSKEAVNLSGDLETLVGRRLSPTLLWQYPNIEALSNYLGSETSSPEAERREQADQSSEAIAVVGIACRFPGSHDAESFWDQLKEGRSGVIEVPPNRWNVSAYYHSDPATPGKMNIRTGGFIENIDRFDANFFGISPREANRMDPQQRLLLEVAWESLENASTPPERLAGSKTGVFVGISSTEYSHLQFSDPYRVDAYAGTGNAHSVAANRISYLLDLRGPSMAIDTACSSSLVAIHLACQSLKRGECNMALAGGVNILLSPELTLAFSQARMMSSKGRCATFDASADGYVRGEGAGVVVLKRLSDALRDQDRIYALVRGSAVNQDGRTNGLTAPNPSAQQAVIREALHEAGIGPGALSYVEAHGTGTPLGDPIEWEALGEVMEEGHSTQSPCLVGSVKTNIGHLESAAGVAGFIKSALALHYGEIPPHLHFTKLSEHVPLDLPLKVPVERTPWPPVPSRYAGVSSFGFGGTNAHIILEEAPPLKLEKRVERSHHLLKLSAKSPEALQKSAERTLQFLQSKPDISLSDLCAGANAGRSDFENRAVLLAADAPEMEGALAVLAQGKASPSVKTAVVKRRVKPKLGFLFTGQGSQYPGMGLKLYQSEASFKKVLDECDEILRPVLGRSLLALMLGKDPESTLIHETGFTQPALFALEIALAELMKSWGVHPDFVMGHSVGEYVAACVAGIFSREEGLQLIALRGRLMQELPKVGGMLAARMPEAKAMEIVAPYSDQVSLAAINGPQSVVFSGKKEKIDALEKELLAQGIGVQALQVSHAFHSPLMDPILAPFEEKARGISFKTPRVPVISNLSGRILEAGEISAAYFRRHLREAVRFEGGIRFLADRGCEIFLELGPKPVLTGMGKRCFDRAPGVWISTLDSNRDDEKGVLAAAGDLYLQGVPLDWKGLDGERARLSLPSYPFEGRRCWLDVSRRSRRGGASSHPLLGERVPSALKSWQFESEISLERLPYLKDHRLSGQVLYPAAAYVETALAAAKEYFGEGSHALREISLEEALFLGDSETRVMQLTLHPRSESQVDFEIFSADEKAKSEDKKWHRHAKGRIERSTKNLAAVVSVHDLKGQCSQELPREGFYGALAHVGLEYGNHFQGIRKVFRGSGQALGQVAHPEGFSGTEGYGAHPALLDAAFQVLAASLPAKQPANGGDPLFIPVGFGRIAVHAPWPASFLCHGALRPGSDPSAKELKGDLKIFDEAGNLLAEVEEFRLKSMEVSGRKAAEPKKGTRAYSLRWERFETPDPSPLDPAAFKGTWLIFSDEEGRGEKLSRQLDASGARSLCVRAGPEFKSVDGSTWMIRPQAAEDYSRLLNEILSPGAPPLKGIVHLWSLKNHPLTDFSKGFESAQVLGSLSLLKFFQSLGEKRLPENPRLWIVTQKAQPVDRLQPVEDPPEMNLAAAPLWGLGRTLALEHPELKTVLLDLDGEDQEAEAKAVFQEISNGLAGDREGQIAWRAGEWYRMRLKAMDETENRGGSLKLPPNTPCRLEVSPSGVMEELHFKAIPSAELKPGQVEIFVKAAGLNFSDVLKALGLYPGLKEGPVPVGIECAGTISRVGPGVSRWKVGDEVAAIAPFCFATHAVTPADYILPKPSFLSFQEAATIPVAFLTAHYALNTLGRMQPGERVLIHAGAGGVGIAAIQMAHAKGLEIFATAGSPEKRAYLKTLGVKQVFDSRSLDFAEELLQATGGEGVDLVLNSLPGEFIPKSLSVLRAYGRFLEIGKIDIYQDRPLGLLPFQNNLSYFAIDLDRLLREKPAFVLDLFKELMTMFEAKILRPLPLTEFEWTEAVQAFRYMAQRKNTGKIILSMERTVGEKEATLFSPKASYLITGGLGGLGLQAARWMTENGARSLILLGRSTPNAEAQKTIKALEEKGARIHVFSVDVGDAVALQAFFERLRPLPPLRGVIHAAGVLEDGIFENLSPEKFDRVFSPKVKGAWELHRLTQGLPLDFFVMFSSIASVLGSPGQANYAAANAFLDALAHERRAKGLAASSVNWGPWAGAGMAAGVSSTGHDLAARGMGLIDPAEGWAFLQKIIQGLKPQELVADVDWNRLAQLYSGTGLTPIFAELAGPLMKGSKEAAASGDIRLLNREAILSLSPEERRELLATQIQSHVAKVLGLQSNQLDLAQPLNTLGLDSLMAIEMKNEIESTLKITLPIATLIKGPNIQELAAVLVEELAKPVSA